MISLRVLCLLLIAPGVLCAQSSPEKLDSSTNNTELAGEVKALREALLQTQKQVAAQQREIETLKAQAEVEPVKSLASELADLHRAGPNVLGAYMRNVRLALYDKAQQLYLGIGQ